MTKGKSKSKPSSSTNCKKTEPKTQPTKKQPKSQNEGAVVARLEEKVKTLESAMRRDEQVEAFGTPNTKDAVRCILCPDELVVGKSLPTLPIAEPRERLPSLLLGDGQVNFGGLAAPYETILTLASGYHTLGLWINIVAATTPGADTPRPGEILLINLRGVSLNGGVPLVFPPSQVPYWVPGVTFANSTISDYTIPVPVPNYSPGFWLSSVAGPGSSSVPTPTLYNGRVWSPVQSAVDPTNGGLCVTNVMGKRVMMCGLVNLNLTSAGGAGFKMSVPSADWITPLNTGLSGLHIGSLTVNFGAELQKLTDRTVSPDLGSNWDVVGVDGYPRLYPASNLRALSLTSILAGSIPLESISIPPSSFIDFNYAGGMDQWDVIKGKSLQYQISELNPADKEMKGFNLRAGLIAVPNAVSYENLDLAFVGVEDVPTNPVDNQFGDPAHPTTQAFSSNYQGSGWGHCCGVSMLRFIVPASQTLSLLFATTVWQESIPPTVSGLPVVNGEFDAVFAKSLQQTTSLPVLATYHSFKDYLRGGLRAIVKGGKRVAAEAWKVGKEVATTALLSAMLA